MQFVWSVVEASHIERRPKTEEEREQCSHGMIQSQTRISSEKTSGMKGHGFFSPQNSQPTFIFESSVNVYVSLSTIAMDFVPSTRNRATLNRFHDVNCILETFPLEAVMQRREKKRKKKQQNRVI